jgi:hypothetical protein
MAKKKQKTEDESTTEQVASPDSLWVLTYPSGHEQSKKQAITFLESIVKDGPTSVVLPDAYTLTRVGPSTPFFTWDPQTPPDRKERRDDDPPYRAIRVNNSLSPLYKMGRLIRPLTAINAEFPVWEVEIEGIMREVHSPEEAWS